MGGGGGGNKLIFVAFFQGFLFYLNNWFLFSYIYLNFFFFSLLFFVKFH